MAYRCGHCGRDVSGAVVAYTSGSDYVRWMWCPACLGGSVADSLDTVYPGTIAGPEIQGLPTDVGDAYQEARRSFGVRAYIATELVCRKILMHIAVDKGAPEDRTFAEYVSDLETYGYVTPPMKPWVDLIRLHGNDAAHELTAPSRARAESTLMFTAELLRLGYEMGHLASKYIPPVVEL